LLKTVLFDTKATDPATHAGVAVSVLALSVAASVVPAFRAMRVDPITVLRND